MNPFFEQRWRDAHTRLITHFAEKLQEQLPEDLVAGAEEDVISIAEDESLAWTRPDVQIREPWTPTASGGPITATEAPLVATEPIYVFTDDEVERWVEVRDETGRLITVIELLSPSNKREDERRKDYINKRAGFVRQGVNVVEIDLVRQGERVFSMPVKDMLLRKPVPYAVSVFRASAPRQVMLYPIPLRSRLPVIRIPLRAADSDALLDLQPLINQCHARGRYHRLDYGAPLNPPLSPEDVAWVDGLLREKGFR
jgi:hypothetical protein